MRISDWSSDVCSSDLLGIEIAGEAVHASRLIYLLETGEAGPVDRGLSIIGAPGVESQDVDAFPCSDRSANAAARAYSQCIGARAQIYITRYRSGIAQGIGASAGHDASSDRAAFIADCIRAIPGDDRSEEHTSELQSLMRSSYAVFCLKKKIE